MQHESPLLGELFQDTCHIMAFHHREGVVQQQLLGIILFCMSQRDVMKDDRQHLVALVSHARSAESLESICQDPGVAL